MRLVSIIAMLLGCLIYSTMSTWAACPMCASMATAASAQTAIQHHEMGGMNMAEIGKADLLKDPCATGGMVHLPFCSACLMVPPTLMVDTGARHVFAYPSPASGQPLQDTLPGPVAPPPRLV
jgi:hypothetical protein